MPKTQTTTKTVKAKAVKKPAKKCPCGKKCECKKTCKSEPETHSLKNLVILWICLFSATILGVLAYAYMVPVIKSNIEAKQNPVEQPMIEPEKI